MFLKGKKIDEYRGFGRRLRIAIDRKGFSDNRKLAEELDKQCSSIINMRKKKTGAQPKDPISYIMRNIQIHLNKEEAYKVPSAYMYAYSIVLDCSLDYLYGRSEIMTSNLSVADICEKTGLSEPSIINLMDDQINRDSPDCFSLASWWSKFLGTPIFFQLPLAWKEYALRILQLSDIDKKINAKQKASKDEEISDFIMKLIYDDDDQKTLKAIRKEKDDSKYGTYNKMIRLIEGFLDQYAEEWANEQHPQYDEMYYRSEINKLQILNSQIDP